MLKLQSELATATKMANLVLQREQNKVPTIREFKALCDARIRMVEVKRKYPAAAAVNDDDLFVDRVVAKKQKVVMPNGAEPGAGQGGTIRIKTSKRDAGYDSQLALGGAGNGAAEHANALQKIQDIQAFVERHLAKRKDNNWEDVTENAFQPLPVPIPQRHFRPIRGQTSL
ncbi:Enhancer of polycomb-like protein 1, partial [Tulasnella sp. 419]